MAPRSYREFAASLIETLEALDLEYAIGGSFASSAYGEARTTVDIDIAIVLPEAGIKRFVDAIERLGYYVVVDAILDAMLYGQPFNVIDAASGYKADMFLVEPTPLERSVFERRRRFVYDSATGASAVLYSPEDVIVYKLKYYLSGRSPKHLRDIAAILVVQGAGLDVDYIARWARELGTLEIWQQLLDDYKRRAGGHA